VSSGGKISHPYSGSENKPSKKQAQTARRASAIKMEVICSSKAWAEFHKLVFYPEDKNSNSNST
jgi:hypothetical protein